MIKAKTSSRVPALLWLCCVRCDRIFYTLLIRSQCDVCCEASERVWPGVVEPAMAVSGC